MIYIRDKPKNNKKLMNTYFFKILIINLQKIFYTIKHR
jgi:hypothetical protein